MTITYLGFLMNRNDREEFVAPVMAEDLIEARREIQRAYPESRYALLTVYSREELEHVLAGVDRWPGLPSKVQEPVAAKSAPVRVQTGGLPKLPHQVQATVEAVESIEAAALPAWMQSLVNAHVPQAATAQPKPIHQQMPAMPQAQPMQQMMAEQRPAQAPQSLIERLKMARGETMVSSQPIRRDATPMDGMPVTRGASGPSVIDILKGMRK